MRISKINNNTNFNARLCGDWKVIAQISKDGGLPEKIADNLLKSIDKVLPNPDDRVFFIFRKPFEETLFRPFKIRSQVEILKEGDIFNTQKLRANVYPFEGEQKDLLANFVRTAKKLVTGEMEPETLRTFFTEKRHPWTENYRYGKELSTGIVNFDEGLNKTV